MFDVSTSVRHPYAITWENGSSAYSIRRNDAVIIICLIKCCVVPAFVCLQIRVLIQTIFFLISQPKHMLWVLKRTDGSFEHPKHMFNLMGKKIITTVCISGLKKNRALVSAANFNSLNLCLLGNFSCFCRLLIFFKIIFFEKFFQKYHQSVKQFVSKHGSGLSVAFW